MNVIFLPHVEIKMPFNWNDESAAMLVFALAVFLTGVGIKLLIWLLCHMLEVSS